MKKATIVFLAIIFGLFFGSSVSFACGHDGGGHEMMQPDSGHGAGHVCPCHEAKIPDTNPPVLKPEVKKPPTAKDLFQHPPQGNSGGEERDGHTCPHHK